MEKSEVFEVGDLLVFDSEYGRDVGIIVKIVDDYSFYRVQWTKGNNTWSFIDLIKYCSNEKGYMKLYKRKK